MDELIREALRERCLQLAIYLHSGVLPLELLGEVEELSKEAWAFRTEDDA
ncbi:MAG TPA: hypothetical protein VJN18_32505 [Polyangiaceae bacterium]|nr:hypothetical protein [Polyangiaceae bacterium]